MASVKVVKKTVTVRRRKRTKAGSKGTRKRK